MLGGMNNQSKFHVSAWPGSRLPHPQVFRVGPHLLKSGVLQPVGLISREGPEDELSKTGEIYLELTRVDLDDEDAIVNFCSRFRVLGIRFGNFQALSELPAFDAIRRRLQRRWPTGPDDYLAMVNHEEGIEDFRFGARCVRDAVRAMKILSGDDDRSGWESLPSQGSWIYEEILRDWEPSEPPSRPEQARFALERLIFAGALAPFAPQVRLAPPEPSEEISLYSICSLEIYNHIAEGSRYAYCRDETCRRLFVRQSGTAAHGQYRLRAVDYCSRDCSHRHAQREYARRKAAEKAAQQGNRGAQQPTPRRRGSTRR
jgi:hypothetical protein